MPNISGADSARKRSIPLPENLELRWDDKFRAGYVYAQRGHVTIARIDISANGVVSWRVYGVKGWVAARDEGQAMTVDIAKAAVQRCWRAWLKEAEIFPVLSAPDLREIVGDLAESLAEAGVAPLAGSDNPHEDALGRALDLVPAARPAVARILAQQDKETGE